MVPTSSQWFGLLEDEPRAYYSERLCAGDDIDWVAVKMKILSRSCVWLEFLRREAIRF